MSGKQGWEYIASGLVDLGMVLLSSYGPKIGGLVKIFPREYKRLPTATNDACEIGIEILANTFKHHKISRLDVFKEMIEKIQRSCSSPAYHYISKQ